MAAVYAHLAHLEGWFKQHLEPLHFQVYYGDLAGALARVEIVRQLLDADPTLNAEEKQLIRYEIAFTPFNFVTFMGEASLVPRCFAQAQAGLSDPPLGQLSAPTRAFYCLALAAKAASWRLALPDPRKAREWLAEIPEERLSIVAWQHLALIGFYGGDKALVEESFGELLTSTSGFRDSYGWLRVNLMHLLCDNRAEFEDFRQLLIAIQHYGELINFKRDFLQLGWSLNFGPELEALIEPLEERLAGSMLPPENEPTTRRVMKH